MHPESAFSILSVEAISQIFNIADVGYVRLVSIHLEK